MDFQAIYGKIFNIIYKKSLGVIPLINSNTIHKKTIIIKLKIVIKFLAAKTNWQRISYEKCKVNDLN